MVAPGGWPYGLGGGRGGSSGRSGGAGSSVLQQKITVARRTTAAPIAIIMVKFIVELILNLVEKCFFIFIVFCTRGKRGN